jgi:hypothetical protein
MELEMNFSLFLMLSRAAHQISNIMGISYDDDDDDNNNNNNNNNNKGKKVKLSLGLTKHHAMKTYWGVEV